MRMPAIALGRAAIVSCMACIAISCSREPDATRSDTARRPAGNEGRVPAGPFKLRIERVGDTMTALASGPRDDGAFRVVHQADLSAWNVQNSRDISDTGFHFVLAHFRTDGFRGPLQQFHFKSLSLRGMVDGREEVVVYDENHLPPPGTANPTVREGNIYIDSPTAASSSGLGDILGTGRIMGPDGKMIFGDFSMVLKGGMTEWARELGSQWGGMGIVFMSTDSNALTGSQIRYGDVEWRPYGSGTFMANTWLTGGANPEGDSSPEIPFTRSDSTAGPFAVKLERSGNILTASATGPGDEGQFRVIQESDLRYWAGQNPGDISSQGFFFEMFHFREAVEGGTPQQFHFESLVLETHGDGGETVTVWDADNLPPAGRLNPTPKDGRIYVNSASGTLAPTYTGVISLPGGQLARGDFTFTMESEMDEWITDLGSESGGFSLALFGAGDDGIGELGTHYGDVHWRPWGAGELMAYHWPVAEVDPLSPEGPTIPLITPLFSELNETHAEVIDQFPLHPQSSKVARLLVKAAVREGLAEAESPETSLMYRFADDNLGLFLLDSEFERLADLSQDRATALLGQVRTDVPGSALSAMATSKELSLNLRHSPEEFLARCADLTQREPTSTEARVALYERFQYLYEHGDAKQAALDASRFVALFPETVQQMNASHSFALCLREAGLLLEADILERLASGGGLAGPSMPLFEDFSRADGREDSAVAAGREGTTAEAYFRLAPDLDRLLEEAEPMGDDVSFEKALGFARLGRIAVSRLDRDRSVDLYGKYLEQVDGLLETGRIDAGSLRRIETIQDVSFDALLGLLGEGGYFGNERVESRHGPGSIASNRFLTSFSQAGVRISSLAAEETGGLDPSTYAAIIDEHIQSLHQLNNRKDVPEAYEDFVARFPSSEEAPKHLMMLADFYRDVSGVPTKAQQTYARVAEEYPNSPEAETADMKHSLLLYESEKYEDALEKLNRFQVTYPESGQVVTAKFLSALCEAAMGRSDEAEAHMGDLVRDHRQHTIAARALFWLGSASLSKQDYGNARNTFLDLMDRYPESEYAKRAGEYVERLSAIEE